MDTYRIKDKYLGTVLATGLTKTKALALVRGWGAIMEKEEHNGQA